VKIFIDESGDPGFPERASHYFISIALIVQNPLAIRRCFAKNPEEQTPEKLPGTSWIQG